MTVKPRWWNLANLGCDSFTQLSHVTSLQWKVCESTMQKCPKLLLLLVSCLQTSHDLWEGGKKGDVHEESNGQYVVQLTGSYYLVRDSLVPKVSRNR
jgi:hypothetical protein